MLKKTFDPETNINLHQVKLLTYGLGRDLV
jgi:hypothetical protein